MLITKQQSVEDLTIESLAKNPYILGTELVSLVQEQRPKTTKQAVYSALRALMESEAVTKANNKYFLSQLWVKKVFMLLQQQNETLLKREAIFDLKDGQSISYNFPSLLVCDTYWAHVANILIEKIPETSPVFIWNPHEWFAIGRHDIEKDIFKLFQTSNKYAFFITRGITSLDREFKKTWSNSHVAIATDDKLSFDDTYYLNIFGDFLIEIFMSDKIAKQIDNFYRNNSVLTTENKAAFERILTDKSSIRMKVSRNVKKASLLRKKLSKDFYIPKHLDM